MDRVKLKHSRDRRRRGIQRRIRGSAPASPRGVPQRQTHLRSGRR